MLEWSAILACMPVEYSSAMPDPDDFDRQLRDLTSGQAEPARFTELSAAERAKRAPTPPPPTKKAWRAAQKAKKLRRPVGDPGPKRSGPKAGKRLSSGGRFAQPRRPASRRQRLLSAARMIGILIAFAALLYGLHLLGFGPS
jgi:hypothetical protein